MEEFNKILWDGIEESDSPAEKKRARSAFKEFLRIVGIREEETNDYRGRYGFAVLSAVLSMSFGFLVAWFLFGRSESPVWNEISTMPGETTQVVLADNTKVTLNGGSTIVYPSFFSKGCRQVYFSGEGYFEVQADMKHPFDVITNGASVQVHGTKFNLKSYSDDNVLSIGLDEGKIQFVGDSGISDKVMVDMVPGDNVSYDRETGIVMKEFSFEGSGLWRKGQYYFKNQPLSDIARDIERLFGVRVLIEREELLDTRYYMALVNGETIDEFISILSLDNSLDVSRLDKTIIIK